ncbi:MULTISPECIES: TonB-dependent receptor plug domain-containing protein [Sphingobium]|jgi:vitamin B12 transporter|uniref:TonB-dependent receptor plug domain-containing protein n=1 Tax=Sphingobium TaxID=165695 RepID=UPI000DBB4BE5|nr:MULTISPECIES: TonB-dependent receptor [Sphingobium]KAA9016180.1 TonB-dependent receptor [Sphingobium limneticum]MBU0933480.1 TonB-dependent receptor [Alphaproteobacteria bacterium]BBD00698.1 vitamin B12 transporter [Sphingobium sp. YG1]
MLKYGLSLVALVAANPALAQADDDIVVTAAGIEQSRDEVGQAITVIDADTIKTRQAIDVVDLLATTPGVRFNRNGTVGAQTGVSLRGAETTQTLVLIDGVKVNDPSGIGDGYDFGPLLTGNIRRIEVLRGSNSVVHGSQAIGGVVNIMTGVPADGFGANASAEYGYSDTFSAKADISGTAGIASGGVGAAYFRTDGISSAANGTERDGSENIAANARLKLAFSDSLSLDLRGYYIHADLDVDGFPAPAYALADTPEVAITDQYVGYAGINLALLDGKLTNRAAVTWMRNDRDYYSARGADVDYGYSGTNLRFEYEGVYAPVDQAKLVFGYEHERPDYDYFGFGSTTSAKINIDSVYALAIVKPFTGLAVTGGVRHDDHSQFGGATTFGANANYSPNGGATNVRLSYGEGFKAPSLYQLYDTFSGNRALTPERSKSYDIGFDQRLDGGRAVLSVTAFQRDTRNQINYDVSLPPFGGYANLDRTRAKGVEASIALKPVDALTVTGSYSYVDARDRSAGSATYGNRLARRAANAVSVSADYVWPFGLSTGATVTMVGDSFDNAANTRRLDGYALAGIRASFPVGEQLEVYGRVDNLTDENYQTAYGYGTYGRAAYGGVRVRF